VRHHVHGQAVHQQVAQGQLVAAAPLRGVDGDAGMALQFAAVQLDIAVDFRGAERRVQRERQQLGQVVLRQVQRRQLPVIGTQAQAVAVLAEGDVARVEVVVDQRARQRLDFRPPVADVLHDGAEHREILLAEPFREFLARMGAEQLPEPALFQHAGGGRVVGQPGLLLELGLAAVPDGMHLGDAADGGLDVGARPVAGVVGAVHVHETGQVLLDNHVGLALRVLQHTMDLRGMAGEARILLAHHRELAHMAALEADAVAELGELLCQAGIAHRCHAAQHQDDFVIQRLDLGHDLDAVTVGARKPEREVAHQLVDLVCRQLGDDAGALAVEFACLQCGDAERRRAGIDNALEEVAVQVAALQVVHRTVAAEFLVGARKLVGGDGRQRGDVERQAPAGDDFGELVRLAGAGAADQLQAFALLGQVGAASDVPITSEGSVIVQ